MANVKKKSSTSKTKKAVKKIEKEKDFELDEDLDDELLEDADFNLDDDEDDELALLETEVEEVSSDERIIRVEKMAKASIVMQVVILILLVVTMGICININSSGVKKDSNNKSSETETETEEGKNTYDTSSFKSITMKEMTSASKNKEIVVFLGRQGCYWCSLYAPIIGLAAEDNKFDVYYLDFGKMVDFTLASPTVSDEDEYDALVEWISASDYADHISSGIGTPMTMFVKNGKIVNFIGGYVDAETLDTYLKKEGFKK